MRLAEGGSGCRLPRQKWDRPGFAVSSPYSKNQVKTNGLGVFFPEFVAKGSRLTLGGLGVESCSRPVASMFATVRNRSQPFATVRNRPQ